MDPLADITAVTQVLDKVIVCIREVAQAFTGFTQLISSFPEKLHNN